MTKAAPAVGTPVCVTVGVTVAGGVGVTVGVGGPNTVMPADAVRPIASVIVTEKSPSVFPAVKVNDPPDSGTLVVLTQPPPVNTVNGGLPPVTTNA